MIRWIFYTDGMQLNDINIINMKGYPTREYLEQQRSKYKAIKALVSKKHEIRINFATSNTCIVQKKDIEQEPNPDALRKNDNNPHAKSQFENSKSVPIKMEAFLAKRARSPNQQEDLIEVLERQGRNLASIGWSEEVPVKRSSNMSRTFRRRRRSNHQDYSTINDNFPQNKEDDSSRAMKNSQLSINNLEMSGFTNTYIIKNGDKHLVPFSMPKSKKDLGKYPKILTFIGEKNMKRVEFLPPEDSLPRGVFAIVNKAINKKWKYQTLDVPQSSKSLERAQNPEANQQNSKEHKEQTARQPDDIRKQVEHPFLKQVKPSTLIETRKAATERRTQSQFIRTRSKAINLDHQRIFQNPKEEQLYRPWTVFKNVQEKTDEARSPKQTIISQNQE